MSECVQDHGHQIGVNEKVALKADLPVTEAYVSSWSRKWRDVSVLLLLFLHVCIRH